MEKPGKLPKLNLHNFLFSPLGNSTVHLTGSKTPRTGKHVSPRRNSIATPVRYNSERFSMQPLVHSLSNENRGTTKERQFKEKVWVVDDKKKSSPCRTYTHRLQIPSMTDLGTSTAKKKKRYSYNQRVNLLLHLVTEHGSGKPLQFFHSIDQANTCILTLELVKDNAQVKNDEDSSIPFFDLHYEVRVKACPFYLTCGDNIVDKCPHHTSMMKELTAHLTELRHMIKVQDEEDCKRLYKKYCKRTRLVGGEPKPRPEIVDSLVDLNPIPHLEALVAAKYALLIGDEKWVDREVCEYDTLKDEKIWTAKAEYKLLEKLNQEYPPFTLKELGGQRGCRTKKKSKWRSCGCGATTTDPTTCNTITLMCTQHRLKENIQPDITTQQTCKLYTRTRMQRILGVKITEAEVNLINKKDTFVSNIVKKHCKK